MSKFEKALKETVREIKSMPIEELKAKLNKSKNSDFAILIDTIREEKVIK